MRDQVAHRLCVPLFVHFVLVVVRIGTPVRNGGGCDGLTEHFGFIEFSHTPAFDMFLTWRFISSSPSALGAYSFPNFVKGAVNCCFSQSLKLVAVVNKCSHVEIRFLCIGRLTTAVKEGHDG